MKKAIKYLMLALLIVPCTLVFAACGNKQMTLSQANKYRYEVYKTQANANQPDAYVNTVTTANKVVKETYFEDVTYKAQGATDPTTEEMEHQRETTYDIKIERSGKNGDVALKVTVSKVEKVTAPTVAADTQLLTGKNTVTTTTNKETYYFGKATVDEVEKFVKLSEVSSEIDVNVDGTRDEDASEVSTTEKHMEAVATTEDRAEENFIESVAQIYKVLDLDWIYNLITINADLYEDCSRVQKGNDATLKLKNFDTFEPTEGLVTETQTVEYKNFGLSKYNAEHTEEGVDGSKTVETTTIESQTTTAAVTLPTDLTTYGEYNFNTNLLYTVASHFNNN